MEQLIIIKKLQLLTDQRLMKAIEKLAPILNICSDANRLKAMLGYLSLVCMILRVSHTFLQFIHETLYPILIWWHNVSVLFPWC